MTHKYEYHVDVRDPSGFYLGALTHVLRDRKLHIRSLDWPPAPVVVPDENAPLPPPVMIRELRIPLTLWTICQRGHGTVLWSQRDCIIVGDGDFVVLLDGGYIVLYNQDPFIDDARDWVTDFIAHHRRDQ